MARIFYKALMVSYALSISIALQSGSSQTDDCTNSNKPYSIDVLTFDRESDRYCYQPLFKFNKETNGYDLCFPESLSGIDLGPWSIFALQKKYCSCKTDEIDEEYEQRIADLGQLHYDETKQVWYHDKVFIEDSFVVEDAHVPVASSYQPYWRRNRDGEIENKIVERLFAVCILSFHQTTRKYCYEHLFSGGNEQDSLLRLDGAVPRTIDAGPLNMIDVRIRHIKHRLSDDTIWFKDDSGMKSRETLMGPLDTDMESGLCCHKNVFEYLKRERQSNDVF